MKTTLIVDADGIAFAAAALAEKTIAWDDDIHTVHGDLNEAKEIFTANIEKCRETVGDDPDVILCFSCPTRHYFRHDILPTYKANRAGGRPPLVLKPLKEWAKETYTSKTKPNLEADDVVGIMATHPRLVKGRKVIVSADKDLDQIPGLHLNPSKLDEGLYSIAAGEAERFLWTQVLTGDQTDGYSGCPGIGAVKAERILDTPGLDYEDSAFLAFTKAGLPEHDFEAQVNMARLLTAETYDFKKEKPILWRRT